MTFCKLVFQKPAEKFILKNKREGLKFYKAFLDLADDKKNFAKYDIKKLQGYEDNFRLRIGKNRAIFKIIDNVKIVIIVFDIGSRGDIYK